MEDRSEVTKEEGNNRKGRMEGRTERRGRDRKGKGGRWMRGNL